MKGNDDWWWQGGAPAVHGGCGGGKKGKGGGGEREEAEEKATEKEEEKEKEERYGREERVEGEKDHPPPSGQHGHYVEGGFVTSDGVFHECLGLKLWNTMSSCADTVHQPCGEKLSTFQILAEYIRLRYMLQEQTSILYRFAKFWPLAFDRLLEAVLKSSTVINFINHSYHQ